MLPADALCLSATAACLQSHHGNLEPENRSASVTTIESHIHYRRGLSNEQIISPQNGKFVGNLSVLRTMLSGLKMS